MPDSAYRFVIEAMTFNHDILQSSIQILTASSAIVKTMTPEVIPGSVLFSRCEGEGKYNAPGITEVVIVLTIARVKAANICFYNTPNISKYCTIKL